MGKHIQRLLSFCLALSLLITTMLMVSVHRTLQVPLPETVIKPDFAAFTNVNEKKSAFFDYLQPMIEKANQRVLQQRGQLLKSKDGELINIAEQYEVNNRLDEAALRRELMLRIDAVPVSLALAQAAKESGWGTSRFARDGNNYFGQWCFSPGCGLVPSQRLEGALHEVQRFNSPQESVSAYIHNLNTHRAYKDLRELRAQQRQVGALDGYELANGLLSYSERGKPYIDEIQTIIRVNKLSQFDYSP